MIVILASTKKNLGKWSLFFLAWGNGLETFHENTIWGRIENYPFSFVWYLIFNPKWFFFMKSFIASLFYVFLASISLFFSFLIFSNSFSFRFRNNTACTPDFFALKFIPPGRAYLMFHFWCCGRERGLGDILSWGKEIFEMCMGGELVLHANMIIKIMYLFVLW